MIISYDPTQPDALTISEFCKTQKISRIIFYRVRSRAATESAAAAAAAIHPRSRAPHHPARRYGPEVINELVHIRKQLKNDGWDYGPKTIHYEATIQDGFPGGTVPSIATIARLLSGVGHVDRNPRKRPKSSYLPFARATAMALWQLDAFEYRIGEGKVLTVYQLLDDATRYDVGSWAYQQHETSHDATPTMCSLGRSSVMERPRNYSVIIPRPSINCEVAESGPWRSSWHPKGLCQSVVCPAVRPPRERMSGRTKRCDDSWKPTNRKISPACAISSPSIASTTTGADHTSH